MAGFAFAVNRASVDDSLATMSETVGGLLGTLALQALVSGILRARRSSAFTSGVLFGLSNLARTLSVGGLPAIALAAGILFHRRTRAMRMSLTLAFLVLAGAALTSSRGFCARGSYTAYQLSPTTA
jgi:hypothetical protein